MFLLHWKVQLKTRKKITHIGHSFFQICTFPYVHHQEYAEMSYVWMCCMHITITSCKCLYLIWHGLLEVQALFQMSITVEWNSHSLSLFLKYCNRCQCGFCSQENTRFIFFSFCLVHSLLKSAFNSIAIEKEKLKQIVSEQDLTGHNAQIAHLRQSLSQVCSWFDFKHIYLAQCTISFVFWPFPVVKGVKAKPSFQPERWHVLLWCRSNLSACGGEGHNLCKHVSDTIFQSKEKWSNVFIQMLDVFLGAVPAQPRKYSCFCNEVLNFDHILSDLFYMSVSLNAKAILGCNI